jgi:hypothetical protein
MNKFQVKYFSNGKYSHEYPESWEKTELFCPACGKREVHEEQSEGDYYLGTWFLCAACGAGFHLPTHPEPRPMNEQDQQRLAAIRDTSNTAGQGRRKPYPEPDCSAFDSKETEDREERCDSCGETSRCLMNGICPMCYELNGGTHD